MGIILIITECFIMFLYIDPQAIELSREAREARLESCMRVIQSKGQLHQRMVTIVMNGLPRAGKTTTKQRLLGRILQLLEVSPSTGVVEPSLKVTITELPRSSAMASGSQCMVTALTEWWITPFGQCYSDSSWKSQVKISTSFCNKWHHSSVQTGGTNWSHSNPLFI